MTQDSLFDASVYVQRAYDQLVLASHHAPESSELNGLKWQMLQAWLSLQQARLREDSNYVQAALTDEPPF